MPTASPDAACGRIRFELRQPAPSPRLHSNVLCQAQVGTAMVDCKVAIHTTLLLVDDDKQQLELQSLVLKKSGFVVLSADSPIEALAILAQPHGRKVSVAILDYEMPVMNGCVLADYLKARYPHLKIILHSGLLDIPESEMSSVDSFVPKGGGIVRLLGEISVSKGSFKGSDLLEEEDHRLIPSPGETM
jgi:CheY-like chemotaxis protein